MRTYYPSLCTQYPREPIPMSIVVSATVLCAGGSLAVVVANPDNSDGYTAIGAFMASICAMFDAQHKNRTWRETARVFIGSFVIGCLLPGFLLNLFEIFGWIAPTQRFTLHIWAFAGFICASKGWGIMALVNLIIRSKKAKKLLGEWIEPATETRSLEDPRPPAAP